jgi:carbon storage regulator
MLVVTRKRDEAIVIGDGIEVRVLRTGRDSVRLGISAPPDVVVHRREVYDIIRTANAAASSADPSALTWVRGRIGRHRGPDDPASVAPIP